MPSILRSRSCGSSGPSADGKDFDYGWEQMRKLGVDMVDEHYYQRALSGSAAMPAVTTKYDRKGPKVFAGDAAHAEHDPNSWGLRFQRLPS